MNLMKVLAQLDCENEWKSWLHSHLAESGEKLRSAELNLASRNPVQPLVRTHLPYNEFMDGYRR